tara:strand:+ start:1689 stop:1847 length:159 start_codon:yes stop_codon:yes gene_type:complete
MGLKLLKRGVVNGDFGPDFDPDFDDEFDDEFDGPMVNFGSLVTRFLRKIRSI